MSAKCTWCNGEGKLLVVDDYKNMSASYVVCPVCGGRKEIITFHEYQGLAMRTCSFKDEMDKMAYHGVFGLASEAGEVSGIFQKIYQGHEIDIDHLKKELGDCLWMITEICSAYGMALSDVASTNIEKLQERYPNGFDPERSKIRQEGDI